MPWVPGTRRVAIYSDLAGRELTSVPVSANPPTVTVTGPSTGTTLPASGQVTVSWTGSDPDNDPLTYSMLYSPDGGTTWHPLAHRISDTSLSVDASSLPGAAGNGIIRVIANDGVNTAFADSTGLIVPFKAPSVTIVSPTEGGTYSLGQSIVLEGSSMDPQDATLSDNHLTWSSSLDGQLGAGHLLVLDNLSAGTHAITLTATDAEGQIATASTTITVTDGITPTGPTLQVSQNTLSVPFDSSSPTTHESVSIRNGGTGDLSWTATSDDARLTLDTASGAAPAELGFAMNTAGLPAGAPYIAHITVTSPGAAQSPQVVTVAAQSTQAKVSMSAESLGFGPEPLTRTTQAQTVTLSYAGAGALNLAATSITGGAPTDFSVASDTCTNAAVVSGSGCTLTVSFRPTKAGKRTAYLVIPESGSARQWYVALSGTGTITSGPVAAWGDDFYGQTGLPKPGTACSCTPSPAVVSGLSDVVSIATGLDSSIAVKADGTVWNWGQGAELGIGTPYDYSAHPVPVQVPGLSSVTAVAASDEYNLALSRDGTVWAWGAKDFSYSNNSQLLPSPVQLTGLGGVIAIAAGTGVAGTGSPDGMDTAVALKADGTVWTWGSNLNGRLGSSSAGMSRSYEGEGPTEVSGPGGQDALSNIVAIAYDMALKADGTVWTWGDGQDGQLGNGQRTASVVPVEVLNPAGTGPLTGVVAIAARWSQRYALLSDGTIVAWGSGTSNNRASLDAGIALGIGGQYPNGTALPMPVVGPSGTGKLTGIVAVQPGIALRQDGTVWAWGKGGVGGLGNGTSFYNDWPDFASGSSAPVQVFGPNGQGHLAGVAAIAGGEQRLVIGVDVSAQPALTVTTNDKSMTYGGAVPSFDASYNGLVNGDSPSSVTTPPTCMVTDNNGSPVSSATPAGTYTITCAGAVAPNYSLIYQTGTLTIKPAPLTITAKDQSTTYGAISFDTSPQSLRFSGFVNNEGPSVLGTGATIMSSVQASSPVGSYTLTPAAAVDPNYTISYVAGNLGVTPAPLVIRATNQAKTYGDNAPALSWTSVGLVNGDTQATVFTAPNSAPTCTTVPASSHQGTYDITCSGASASNYAISYVSGILTVNPAPLSIIADAKTMVYGAAPPPFTVSYNGLVNGDTMGSLAAAPTCTSAAGNGSSVGVYAITCSGAVDHDYTMSYGQGALTITPASLTVTPSNQTKLYLAATPPLTGTVAGLHNGDLITATSSRRPTTQRRPRAARSARTASRRRSTIRATSWAITT